MGDGALTVFLASDLQCGHPYLARAGDAMIELARRIEPDVIVVAGDLTQRAKREEFEAARRLLDRFGDVPLVVTPGNHDVPLYRVWERLVAPFSKWRAFAGPGLDTITGVEGATFVALNSAAPRRRIVGGRLTRSQIDYARAAFARAPAQDHRIVVIHHHFVPVADGAGGRPLGDAADTLRAFEEMGTSAVLGGHVHQLHVHDSGTLTGGKGMPVIATGTATSRRGRGVEAGGGNSVCVLRFLDERVTVEPYRRMPGQGAFEPLEARTLPLRARTAARKAGPVMKSSGSLS